MRRGCLLLSSWFRFTQQTNTSGDLFVLIRSGSFLIRFVFKDDFFVKGELLEATFSRCFLCCGICITIGGNELNSPSFSSLLFGNNISYCSYCSKYSSLYLDNFKLQFMSPINWFIYEDMNISLQIGLSSKFFEFSYFRELLMIITTYILRG